MEFTIKKTNYLKENKFENMLNFEFKVKGLFNNKNIEKNNYQIKGLENSKRHNETQIKQNINIDSSCKDELSFNETYLSNIFSINDPRLEII